MASSKGIELLVVSSNLTPTMKTLFKEKRISSCQESDKSLSLWSPEIVKNFGLGTIRTKTKNPAVQKGGRVLLALVRVLQ